MDAQIGFVRQKPAAMASALTPLRLFAILLAVALFTRIGEFNNPLTHVDDEFYLVTGNALLHGQLPYVDIWDRKPIGLFLIYAAIAALPGDSIIVYHLVAAAAALATALVLYRLTTRVTGEVGAMRAAVLYLALLPTMGGAGGQSPVFYNLLTATAALLALDAHLTGQRLRRRGMLAMLLMGLAIQIKPTTLFEGVFFGLVLLAAEWRAHRSLPSIARFALPMAAIAVAPTIVAFAVYAALGHADAMWFATVVSIFKKAPLSWRETSGDALQLMFFLSIPILIAASALATRLKADGLSKRSVFLVGWAVFALIGFASVPNLFNHYWLPMLLPIAAIAAGAFNDRRDGLTFTIMALFLPLGYVIPSPAAIAHNRDGFDRGADYVRSHLGGGCLYVYHGPPIFYLAANACHASPYVFPDHLESVNEAKALPVDPTAEVERIFASRPSVVITEPQVYLRRNNAAAEVVERNLACNYRIGRQLSDQAGHKLTIWIANRDHKAQCPIEHPPLGIVSATAN